MTGETILDVRDLRVEFERADGVARAVNSVSFQARRGEWLGILGESGSGKSVTLLSLLGLLSAGGVIAGGAARFAGADLFQLGRRRLRTIRGREIGYVFQSLVDGLDPGIPVGRQIMESMLAHRLCTKGEARRRALDLMREMGLPDPEERFGSYPSELSGGMRQRVMIAVALACEPALLLADEPTAALDSTVQVQVLATLQQACRSRGMAVIMVTHDLGVAASVCDRVMVMYGGQVMETADIDAFLGHAAHPYTLALKAASFDPADPSRPVQPISGAPPSAARVVMGCPFAGRCPFTEDICRRKRPEMVTLAPDHEAACHRLKERLS